MTLENSPSKVPVADQPFIHLISADAVVSAASLAGLAPFTTKDAPGRAWKVAATARSGLKSCAQAARPRKVRIAFCIAKDLSARRPSSLRVRGDALRIVGQREGVGAGYDLFGIGGQVERGELPRCIGRDAEAAEPWADKAIAGFGAAGEGVGVELRAQAIDAGDGNGAIGHDILPAIGEGAGDVGCANGVTHECAGLEQVGTAAAAARDVEAGAAAGQRKAGDGVGEKK